MNTSLFPDFTMSVTHKVKKNHIKKKKKHKKPPPKKPERPSGLAMGKDFIANFLAGLGCLWGREKNACGD